MLASDLHIHTIMSGHAFNTLKECVDVAREKKISLIAITDHGPSMEHSAHEGYFEMGSRLPSNIEGINILFGCEANILDTQGNVDISAKTRDNLALVLAGLHKRTPYEGCSIVQNTNAILNTICHLPQIHIISHPYRQEFPVDIQEIVCASIEHRVLLEVNMSLMMKEIQANRKSDVLEETFKMIQLLQEKNMGFVINSDAHFVSEIGIDNDRLQILTQRLNICDRFILNNHFETLAQFIPSIKKLRITNG